MKISKRIFLCSYYRNNSTALLIILVLYLSHSKDTNFNTSIEITGVAMGAMGTVVVNYKTIKGAKTTYTIRPFAALLIDKNQTGKIIFNEIK